MDKINEHPKIFISYSWSSKEYEEKVMDLAVKLQGDGVEVIIDKWIMQPGNDTINFMEKCVKDPEINYVLMLLDKKYTEKANNRSGGVGIETQIISNEVYNDVEQSKFIPIVFDRDEDGKIYVPIYLKSKFHYDLTQDNSDEEYVKLVKQIYGRQIYYKPQLGNKPKWVDENLNNPSALKLKVLQTNKDINIFQSLAEKIKKSELGEDKIETIESNERNKVKIEVYNKSLDYRNTLIEIFLNKNMEENFIDDTCDFYEEIKNWNKQNNGIKQEIWDSFIHESFIYLIAILFKYKRYKLINTFITKSYFQNGYSENITTMNYYFYSHNYDLIENAKREIDNQNYFSGMAQIWIENIYVPKITKQEFTKADLLIYNLSILLLNKQSWYWFPITYVYAGDSGFNSSLKDFSIRLKSKYEINRMKELFGISSVGELKELFNSMIPFIENIKERYRYSMAFEYSDLILDTIKIEEIGTLN